MPDRQQADAAALVDQAADRVADHGHDPDTILAMALERMAEEWADDSRPLCPDCGKRRLKRSSSAGVCRICAEQREDDLMDKLAWWQRNGHAWRAQRTGRSDDAVAG